MRTGGLQPSTSSEIKLLFVAACVQATMDGKPIENTRQEIEHLSHANPNELIKYMNATVMQMKRTFQQRFNRVVARHSK